MSERCVPVLPSRDLDESLAFYERLGFSNRGPSPDEWDYLILGRGGLELHLFLDRDVDPLRTAGSCYCFVEDAMSLHEQWNGVVLPDPVTGSRIVDPQPTDYGMHEFAVVDSSGNLVRVGSPS